MKILRRMKVRSNKIFAYFSLFSMVANTLSPFAAMIPSSAYAEDIAAPVEVVEEKEPAEELGIESEAVDTGDAADGQDLAKEEISGNEITEEDEGSVPEEEVVMPVGEVVDPEAPDILEDGVMDYNPINDIEEVVEIEEIPTPVEEEVIPEVEEPVQIEYEELSDDVEITDSVKEDWTVDGEVAETKEVVRIGIKYIFPLDEEVTLTFTRLPKDEELRSHLKIERVKVEDLDLPDDFVTDAEYAFDITTDMENGDFEFDLTLPKPEGSEVEVTYIEKSIDEAKEELKDEDIKKVDEDKVEQDEKEDKVKVKDLDHLTLFIPTGGVVLSVSGSVNGVTQVTVEPSGVIKADITVQRSGSGSENDWESTSWRINEGSWNCADTTNHTIGSGTNTESFDITAPSTVGTYSISFRAHRNGSCGDTGVSNTFTLTNGIIVQSAASANVCNNEEDSYSLDSSGGIWTSVNGGSNITGLNTNEVKWGNSTGHGQSGLRFDSVGTQTFNENTKFLLGTLTHKNWPINNAANGATLQIKLSFSEPAIPDKTFSYNFDIDETTNTFGTCPSWQQTSTPCDDKITFPNSYGSEVITINDIQYTLVIDGFVNSYSCESIGNVLNYFITEEQKDNSAYLVGHLSSVLVEKPEIRLTKKTNGQDISAAPGENLSVGDTVTWEYVVQNSGNVTLTNISLTDSDLGSITCPSTELAKGVSMTCTATGTVTAGQYENTATVKGTTPSNTEVSASDTSWYSGISKKGHLIVQKTTLPSGDQTEFTTYLKNSAGAQIGTGIVTDSLDKDYEVDAGTYSVDEGIIDGWSQNSNTCSNVTVAAGETTYCTITNTKLNPALTIVKTATPITYDEVGDVISYSFLVTNSGNVSLDGPVSINDDKVTDKSCPSVDTVGNLDSKLDPTENITCTASYTITQADLNAGSVTNVASASADGTTSPTDTETVTSVVGSIRVCKVILDSEGNIVNGSSFPGLDFSISGLNVTTSVGSPAGVIGKTEYSTPIDLNSDLFSSFEGDDAYCVTYDKLALGHYYYGEEVLESSWLKPLYNDSSINIGSAILYSGELFDDDGANDDNRNTLGDGDILLTAGNRNRTLLVINQYQGSDVKICKVDNKQRPQKGWEVVLASEKVSGPKSINVSNGSGTDSLDDLPAGKYLIKVSGTYRYGSSSMNADAGFSYRPLNIPSGCDCWLSGFDLTSGSNGLMAWVNGDPVNWGTYNDNHVYTYVYDHFSTGPINISIKDDVYGDNVNNNNFQFEIYNISKGYYGTTGENGCVTLENVPYGNYLLDEFLKEGWADISGKGSLVSVDSSEESFKLVNRIDSPVEIVATKIVCTDEKDLPNWGYGASVDIKKDTATEWLKSHPSCHLESDWSFQWGDDGDTNPSDSYIGEVAGWNTFGPTNSNGTAVVKINDFGSTSQIKVREVLKENYIPFTYLTNGNNSDNVSAEIYCDTDVLNYDNDDRFTPEYGKTYYCVAFNAPTLGDLEVTKTVDWTGITPDPTKTFEICIKGPSYPSGDCKTVDYDGDVLAWNDLIVGDYDITETNPGSIWSVVGSNSTISITAGYVTTHEVTNTYIPYCGDGVKNQESEQCDGTDGVTDGENFCTPTCKLIPIYDGGHSCTPGKIEVKVGETHILGSQDSDGILVDLLGGHEYLFKAYGTYAYDKNNSGRYADAAYGTQNNWGGVRTDIGIWGTNKGVTSILGDLGQGIGVIEWDNDKEFNDGHAYRKVFTPGSDISAQFLISDWYSNWYNSAYNNQGGMGDNEDQLNLEVYECVEPGSITVTKFNDKNGNGEFDEGENVLSGWEINLSQNPTKTTDDNGHVLFNQLVPGNYDLSETMQDGWDQTNIYCEDSGEGVKITKDGEAYGHHGNCEGWNGCKDASTCALWACEVNGYSSLVSYGEARPCTQFNNCHLFNYRGSVQMNWGKWCEVMGVTDIVCSNSLDSDEGDYYIGYVSGSNITVDPGQNKNCYIGNIENSKLYISETNDSWPNNLGIGDEFTYTIKVIAKEGPVNNALLTNLPPKGFEPQGGTFKAVSDLRGDLDTSGVTYASPGKWDLGNLKEDEIVTISYKAKVLSEVTAGIYPDLSFANGKGMGGKDLPALSEASGFAVNEGIVDGNFVGTQVRIALDTGLETEVKVKEEEKGDVLGASTELPATGARTFWVTSVLVLVSIGGALLLIGGLGTMKKDKKQNKKVKTAKKVLTGLLFAGIFTLTGSKSYAAVTNVRLSQPKSPSNSDFSLVFVAMDTEDRDMTAKCYYKFEGGAYSQFGPEIAIASGESGDSRTCAVGEAVLDEEGNYTFKVEVTPDGDLTKVSNEVAVDYDGEGPDKPKYIEKEKVNDCVNKITLKTADDDETTSVQVFADDDKEIDIDDSHKIETESIGSDEKFDFEHVVSGDDCDKTWYYAVVAFDDAGNASKPRAEEITTTTTTTEEEETEAIPVEGGAGIVEGGVAGEGATGPEGAEGEEGEGALEVDFGEGEEGSVLGEETAKEGKTLFKSPWFWIVSAGLGILIISATRKKKA